MQTWFDIAYLHWHEWGECQSSNLKQCIGGRAEQLSGIVVHLKCREPHQEAPLDRPPTVPRLQLAAQIRISTHPLTIPRPLGSALPHHGAAPVDGCTCLQVLQSG